MAPQTDNEASLKMVVRSRRFSIHHTNPGAASLLRSNQVFVSKYRQRIHVRIFPRHMPTLLSSCP